MNCSYCSLIILATLCATTVNAQVADRFTHLDSDFGNAAKDRWSLRLVYPSNAASSHRIFAVDAMAEMKQQATNAIPLLTGFVKKTQQSYPGKDWHEDQDSLLGIRSLVALAEIASPNAELANELEKFTSREGSIFKLTLHTTAEALIQLRNGSK